MIVRSLEDLPQKGLDIAWGNGRSRRFLVRDDGMGYSLTDTLIDPNTKSTLEYKNHLEACYCIAGSGKVIDEQTGEEHEIIAGTMYALNENDRHQIVTGDEGLRLVCMFTPALRGDEVHNLKGDGSSSAY